MRNVVRTWLALAVLAAWASGVTVGAGTGGVRRGASAGPHKVGTVDLAWHDPVRKTAMPVRLYYPWGGRGPFPVILFSHGLGGSREGYAYLGRHWASHGYVCVHLHHVGSDASVWQGVPSGERLAAMREAANLRNTLGRLRDVSLALTQLSKLNGEEGPFEGRLDLSAIGLAGHSFGAQTTLLAAGQKIIGPRGQEAMLGEPRIKAAIAMSAPVPPPSHDYGRVYGSIRTPCLHMTGTEDDSPIGNTTATQRRIPFDHIDRADQYLVTFTGGDHMVFAGPAATRRGNPRDASLQALVRIATTAFWDAYLRADPQAMAWLQGDGLRNTVGRNGTVESSSLSDLAGTSR